MILLRELKIVNFLSHENTTLVFDENEKLLLDGKSGSGKSSIVEALVWCLYGKGRSDNRSLVRRGAKNATVYLKLGTGEQEYIITRAVSTTGKNTLVVTTDKSTKGRFVAIEAVGSRGTQEFIEKILLKASFELFTNSICYPQENENSFVKANASRRKDLLLEIVRAENFDVLYEKARQALSSNETEGLIVISKVEGFEKTIKDSTEMAGKAPEFEKEIRVLSAKIETFQVDESALTVKLSSFSTLQNAVGDKLAIEKHLLDAIASKERQIDSNKKTIDEVKKIDIEIAKKGVEECELLIIKAEEVEKQLKDDADKQNIINRHLSNKPSVTDYSLDIESINKRLIPLIKDTNKCPSGDACPFVVPIKGQIDFLTEQITEKTEKGAKEKLALEVWEKEYFLLPKPSETDVLYIQLQDLRAKIKNLSSFKETVVSYNMALKNNEALEVQNTSFFEENKTNLGQLTTVVEERKELERQLEAFNMNQINLELSTLRIKISELHKNKDVVVANHALSIQSEKNITEASTGLLALSKESKALMDSKESLSALKEALSPGGLKAVIIDYLVPELESKINFVLQQMSDFRIKIDTQAPKTDEGIKEGLFLTVINDIGEELPLENLSGGETIKCSMAISEALAGLTNSVGFRILDEAINSLDSESTQSFVGVLIKLQEKFPQVFVVSHLDEVKDIFEKKILITKVNGISKII